MCRFFTAAAILAASIINACAQEDECCTLGLTTTCPAGMSQGKDKEFMCCTQEGHDGKPGMILPCPRTSSVSSTSTTTAGGLRCLSETVSGLTGCVMETCAVEADECLYSTAADDTCAQFESTCNDLFNECCKGGCKTEAADLLDCATGDICPDFTCGARRALQAEPSPPFSRKLELGGLGCVSEATTAYTKCLINNCPGADAACTMMAGDGDTCQDVADFCPTVNDCCPACQTSLEALLDCSTGDLCGAFDCATGTVGDTPSTPATTPAATTTAATATTVTTAATATTVTTAATLPDEDECCTLGLTATCPAGMSQGKDKEFMCCTQEGHDGKPGMILPCPRTSSVSSASTTTAGGLRCLSETVSGLTGCVMETCAVEADECLYSTAADDTCAQFESTCNDLFNECCKGGCKTEAADLLDCATGDICPDFTCGARRALQAEPSPPFSRKLELGGLGCVSETTSAYTKCLINNCPGADAACTMMAGDGDTCQDVADFCPTVNDCCPACQTSLEALLDCSTGDLCSSFDCGAGTVVAATPAASPSGDASTRTIAVEVILAFAALQVAM